MNVSSAALTVSVFVNDLAEVQLVAGRLGWLSDSTFLLRAELTELL